MTILGDPIHCSGRPDWLRDDDVCAVEWRNWQGSTDAIPARHWTTWPNITDLRLPADHPVYAIIKAGLPLYTREAGGWRPWFGEMDCVPDDWDRRHVTRSNVIFARGGAGWGHSDDWWEGREGGSIIIAYLAKPAEDAAASPETQPEEITLATAISVIESHGYAAVQKRTETAVRLGDCPVGLFQSENGQLCVKTEYRGLKGQIDAYIVSSGEFFWGGQPQTVESQHNQRVCPVVLAITPTERDPLAGALGREPTDAERRAFEFGRAGR